LPRPKSTTLTDAELKLMTVLWDKGSATVSDVVDSLDDGAPLAYSTVLTTLRVLENKGYLRHVKEGRAFIYRPIVGRYQARDSATTHLIRRFFGGSPELLMLNLVERRKLSPKQLRELRERIAKEGLE
jgi:predicted transcriptional regulator